MTDSDRFTQTLLNLAKYHREHEKFYSDWPLDRALRIRSASRMLCTLADRWAEVQVAGGPAEDPYAGCEDLNEPASIQAHGVLFMEGEAEPGEIERTKRELRSFADDFEKTGEWLSKAMESAWEAARTLLPAPGVATVLGERHRIIANNWEAASMSLLIARLIHRAVDIVEQLELSPKAIRADLIGLRAYPARMHSAAEMLDRAATLATDSAARVRDNERRWRIFRMELKQAASAHSIPSAPPASPRTDRDGREGD